MSGFWGEVKSQYSAEMAKRANKTPEEIGSEVGQATFFADGNPIAGAMAAPIIDRLDALFVAIGNARRIRRQQRQRSPRR